MQSLLTGVVVGLALGFILGPALLNRAGKLSKADPGAVEIRVTRFILVLALLGLFRLPAWLVPDPALVFLMTGFGGLAYLLLRGDGEAARWPLPIRLMHLYSGVLLFMFAARLIFQQLLH